NTLVDPALGCSSTSPRCRLYAATGISPAGQIVGVGRINGREHRAFRLRYSLAGQRDYPVGLDPRGVATGKFNLDAYPDLAVVNRGTGTSDTGTVSVLLWKPQNFVEAKELTVGQAPYALAVADFDGDNRPDVAVALRDEGRVTILRYTDSLSFQPL